VTDRRSATAPWSGHTAWATDRETPLRAFLRTETGSAAVLLFATLAALAWVNIDAGSYAAVWHTPLGVRLGDHGLSQDLRGWVNTGLMTFFFFVVGLEARREFDMGELRERSRLALPVAAGIGGMLVPVAIYLALNASAGSGRGWGTAMATDTAFALGMLALLGPRFPDRLRVFLLTVAVVDDLISLAVIAVFYTERIRVLALVAALVLFGVVLVLRARRLRTGAVYFVLGVALWVALYESGVDPLVVGLAMGLITYAYPAPRTELERASDLFRLFREQPTPELERSARAGLDSAISPNERLSLFYHPWASYLIVPLFALANAGIVIDGAFLARAYRSPITLGIILGYTIGKPVGVVGATLLVRWLSRGRVRPPVGWAAVAGAGTIAGIGFTVSLLVATLAFTGVELEEAKLGVLTAAAGASMLTWVVFRVIATLSPLRRAQALLGTAESVVDLAVPVDPDRDHVRGPHESLVTVVEYGDFECPYCGRAEPVVRELLAGHAEVRYVWRHLPLHDVHPHAQLAAEATEAAHEQGAFWAMHDLLFEHQDALTADDLAKHAERLGLDVERFRRFLDDGLGTGRVAEDLDSADLSGVSGTPTFFINGRRHHGAYDIESLTAAVKTAKTRAVLTS
jgi:Na+/H+ antiporter NhaA